MGIEPSQHSVLEPDPDCHHDISATTAIAGPGAGPEREEDVHPHPLQSHPVHIPRSQHLQFQSALGYSPAPPESKHERRRGHDYVPGPVYGGLPPILDHDEGLPPLSPTAISRQEISSSSSSSSNSNSTSQQSPSSLPSLSPPTSYTDSAATASPSSGCCSTLSPASPTPAEEKPLLRKRRSIFFFGAGAGRDLPLPQPLSLSQPRSLSRRQSIGSHLRSSVVGIAGRALPGRPVVSRLASRRAGISGVDEG